MSTAAARLDRVFQALSNPTRRAVVQSLARGPAAVTDLAAPFDMALPSFMQHLKVLEASGLIRTRKVGRVRTVEVEPRRLREAEQWMSVQRSLWERRLDQFDDYLTRMHREKGRRT